ncbi:MAG: hypothetical protein M1812_004359 [Candelaria pacifica]|nr:MAG: hypothetical protein M1812_004359 [Candelaria pacifica]
MAVMLERNGSGVEDRQSLHPFFDKARLSRQTSLDSTSAADARPTPPPSVEEAISKSKKTRGKAKIKPPPHELSRSSQARELRKVPQQPVQISGDGVVAAGYATGRHHVVKDKSLQGGTTESTDPSDGNTCLEDDPNFNRRKRRKTSTPRHGNSPDHERMFPSPSNSMRETAGGDPPSQRLQMQATACTNQVPALKGPAVRRAGSPDYQRGASFPDEQVATSPKPRVGTPPSATLSGHAPPSSYIGTAKDETTPHSSSPTRVSRPPVVTAQGASPPKKKILRLNAKGKFSAPVAKSRSAEKDSKPARAPRKSKIAALKPEQLIVILKYGHDTQSKAALGAKIAQVLHSSPKVSTLQHSNVNNSGLASFDKLGPKKQSESVSLKSAAVTPKDQKPAVLPKSTHPFFLAKPGPKIDFLPAKVSGHDNDKLNPEGEHDPIASPRKSRTPRKGVAGSEALSGLVGLSQCTTSLPRNRISKYPGTIEPAWPCKDTVHVRGLDLGTAGNADRNPGREVVGREARTFDTRKKLKEAVVQVPASEDILLKIASGLGNEMHHEASKSDESIRPVPALRLPTRSITTGRQIQRHVLDQVHARFLASYEEIPTSMHVPDKSTASEPNHHKAKPTLSRLYDGIGHTLTSFDKGQRESHAWIHKYAPGSAEDVLQAGREALILRDWLQSSVVQAIDTGSAGSINSKGTEAVHTKSDPSQSVSAKVKRRKRKRAEELEGFVVSSDEEGLEMDELMNPEDINPILGSLSETGKAVVRSQISAMAAREHCKVSNAVVISGPHGCGKTAAIYAVAKELGFEVFEINSGSRRSGKDVLDKVGEMTRNHLVQQANIDEGKSINDDISQISEALKEDLATGRQGTMNSFFKPKPQVKHPVKTKPRVKSQKEHGRSSAPQHQKQQKQSLILLEEVDVLFQDDKQFWATILMLVAQSKRPIVMTCNDESLIPMDTLSLYAILRFAPPPCDLAVDYLLLLAAKEGHLLARHAVSDLLKTVSFDLRASIMELDFWCQIGVGDRKGGLEWIYQRWPPGKDVDEQGDVLRVASKHTYLSGMGCLAHKNVSSGLENPTEVEEDVLLAAWDDWEVEVEETDLGSWALEMDPIIRSSHTKRLSVLSSYDTYIEAISAADVYSGLGLRAGGQIPLDTTQPRCTESLVFNSTEGYPLLKADPMIDYSRLGTRMALSIKRTSKRFLQEQAGSLGSSATIPRPLSEDVLERSIRDRADHCEASVPVTRAAFSAAFDSLAEAPNGSIAQSQGLQASVFDRNFSVVVEDLAPYIRTIVAYDLRLEEERLQLSNLLSQGGRNGKRMRTTRASRSALEGGTRSNTRRERWFTNELNPALVLKTGGKEWQKFGSERGLHARADDTEPNGSPSSSQSSNTSISITD